jgi:hypothetical protein
MSSASTAFVWIKASTDAGFAMLSVDLGELVGSVIERACTKYIHWQLNALQVRIHLVADSGDEPGDEAIDAALAKKHLLVSAGVTSGAWLVAVPTTPAGGSGSGGVGAFGLGARSLVSGGILQTAAHATIDSHTHTFTVEERSPPTTTAAADINSLVLRMEAHFGQLQLQLSPLIQQVVTKDFRFSAASPSAVRNLLAARNVREHDDLPLPLSIKHLKPPSSNLKPFTWRSGVTETAASSTLLQLLERWVKSGATPAMDHAFVDVQGLAAHCPLEVNEPGVGHFKGVPDMAILCHGAKAAGTLSPLAACAVAVDWKTPSALAEGVKQQAFLQVLALYQLAGTADEGPPVFFTDLKTHFLCFRLVQGDIYCYEGAAAGTNALSLAEGVGLIRYFLLMDMEKKVSRLAAAALAVTSSSVGGGTGQAGAGGVQRNEEVERRGAMSRGGGEACEDYGPLDSTENNNFSEALDSCSIADAQALNIAEMQSIALALTYQLTAYGGIDRKVFFQQQEESKPGTASGSSVWQRN